MKAEKKSFVMYKNWKPSIDKMNLEQKGLLLDAIMAYQTGEEVTIDDLAVDVFFAMVKDKFDEDGEKYEKACESKSEAAKQREAQKAQLCTTVVKKHNSAQKAQLCTKSTKEGDSDTDCEGDSDCVSEDVSDGVSDCGFEKSKSINAKEKQSKKKAAASAYVDDPELNSAIVDFIEHRKKLRKPMTDRAIDLFIKRVNDLAISTQEQIELINTAIERGWQTVYPREEKARSGTTSGLDYLYEMATGGVI